MTLMIVNLNLSVANREERVEDGIKFQPCRGLLYAVLKRPHGKTASRWTLSYSESSPRYYCESYEYQFIKWNRAVYIRNRFSAVYRCGKFLWNKKTILSITSYSAKKNLILVIFFKDRWNMNFSTSFQTKFVNEVEKINMTGVWKMRHLI